ncbi:TPA: hypothetical protein IAC10_04870 [Candidatus Scatousia excrementigallinarum]|uniref:Uncharacterized protein n=1 Tax=Candidatus Scatousia excrementigallinarum TaxID=2840935 RepID=A0A9D1JMI7_9BACT|nr:hypothetical protein [Candidatus Scatousia excrementigallinarum]
MKPKEEDLEQILLNNASLDELIKMKIEKEFKSELVKAYKKPHKKTITDISKVPKGMVFSKQAVFKHFNRRTKSETFINGVQAEAMLGIQNSIREKIYKGELSAFTTEDAYVKFEKIDVEV